MSLWPIRGDERRGHPEPVRFAQGKLREGSAVPVRNELMQILRSAQNDRLSGELQVTKGPCSSLELQIARFFALLRMTVCRRFFQPTNTTGRAGPYWRLPLTVLTLLSVSSPVGASGSFQPRVHIPKFAEVQGETIRLSDLLPPGAPAELGQVGSQITLGNSPLPASQRVISKDQIEQQLREFPSLLERLELPERLIISCKRRRLSSDEIWKAIETFLAAEGLRTSDAAVHNVLRFQAPVYVTKEDPGLVVQRMEPDRIRRQIRFLLWTSSEPQLLPFYVTADGPSRKMALTNREAGPPAMPADGQATFSRAEEGKFEALLNGTSRGVSVRKAGAAPLATSPPVILVTKGKPAKLVVQTETLRMTVLVTPLESGAQGQIIRVQNLDTQRMFLAEVVGAGLLQARLAGE